MNKKYIGALALVITIAGFGASHVNAQTPPPAPTQIQGDQQGQPEQHMRKAGMMRRDGIRPAVFGQVTAINGNTITVTSKNPTNSVFTVDATNAKITKDRTAGTISSIVVGDNIAAFGTLNGTNITATQINDGMMRQGQGMMQKLENGQGIPVGNGQPVIGGTISAISGNTVTITNNSGATFTIDATNAKINKAGTSTATISNLAVGETILAQGTINGQNVTATTIIDHGVVANQQTQGAQANPQTQPKQGFFGRVGGFFKHMFGF